MCGAAEEAGCAVEKSQEGTPPRCSQRNKSRPNVMRYGLLPVVYFATGSASLDIKALWHPGSCIKYLQNCITENIIRDKLCAGNCRGNRCKSIVKIRLFLGENDHE